MFICNVQLDQKPGCEQMTLVHFYVSSNGYISAIDMASRKLSHFEQNPHFDLLLEKTKHNVNKERYFLENDLGHKQNL